MPLEFGTSSFSAGTSIVDISVMRRPKGLIGYENIASMI